MSGKRDKVSFAKKLFQPIIKVLKYKKFIWFKIFISFILVATLPLLTLTIISSQGTTSAVYNQASRFSRELVKETSQNIENRIDSLQNTLVEISYMEDVLNIANGKIFKECDTKAELSAFLSDLRFKISYKLNLNRDITDVIIYSDQDVIGKRILYGDQGLPFKLMPEHEEKIIGEAYEAQGGMVVHAMSGEHQASDSLRLRQDERLDIDEYIIISRAIRSIPEGDMQGVLVMRLNAKYFAEHLQNIDVGQGTQFVVVDEKHKTIVNSTNEEMFEVPHDPLKKEIIQKRKTYGRTGDKIDDSVWHQFDNHKKAKEDYSFLKIDSQKYVIYSAFVDDVSWRVYCFVPSQTLEEQAQKIFLTFILILIPLLILILIGLRLFHSVFNKPLIELVAAMNAAEENNLNVEVNNTSPDEIGQAARSFNHMIERIRFLLDDVKEQEKSKRLAELTALQAQVNPHFLSNTLNVARLMAQTQKAENIDELLEALIDLLHIIMDIKSDTIPLKEEIGYIKSYVKIARYKNYNGFDIEYCIDPEIEEVEVPKLILLPLVENAVIHGINGNDHKGQISIRAISSFDDIIITVSDNGTGIHQAQIPFLLKQKDKTNKKRFSGIGLSNVNERIKRIYGEEYGVFIDSVYMMYTTVEIIIPNRRRTDNIDPDTDS